MMFAVVALILANFLVLQLPSCNIAVKVVDEPADPKKYFFNGTGSWDFDQMWHSFMNVYGVPFANYCINTLYALYNPHTFSNIIFFTLKFGTSGFYTWQWIKYLYGYSNENFQRRQMELEEIQLQIKIVNEKLCIRETESNERAERLRLRVDRLRYLRSRVRSVIASDEALRRRLDDGVRVASEGDISPHSPENEHEFMITLLNELKEDHYCIPELSGNRMDCGEPLASEQSDDSMYSSLDESDAKQECRVKILKVTNVYKVAYLKHYIKQKKLRRATQRAMLKEKIESIKKLLEDWQKSLNMVINSKLILDSSNLDVTSQEAMGDYAKPNARESDSNSDILKNSDSYFDEYSVSWTQNPYYRNYGCDFEDVQQSVTKEYYEAQEYTDNYAGASAGANAGADNCAGAGKCAGAGECAGTYNNVLFILPEETSSQMAIEEIKEDANEYESSNCRDMVASRL